MSAVDAEVLAHVSHRSGHILWPTYRVTALTNTYFVFQRTGFETRSCNDVLYATVKVYTYFGIPVRYLQ